MSGGESVPIDGRQHDLSDGIVLCGLKSLAKTSTPIISISSSGGITISLQSGQKVSIINGASVEALGTSALALKSDIDATNNILQALITAYNAHTNGSYPLSAPYAGTAPTAVGTTKLKGA
jgi:hypothetical protein